MVSVTVSAAGKPTPLARGLPVTLDITTADPTVADVKASLASKYPKVRVFHHSYKYLDADKHAFTSSTRHAKK